MNVLIVCALNATWVSLCVMCSACMERPSKQNVFICDFCTEHVECFLCGSINLSSFIHPRVVQNLYNLQVFCSALEQSE